MKTPEVEFTLNLNKFRIGNSIGIGINKGAEVHWQELKWKNEQNDLRTARRNRGSPVTHAITSRVALGVTFAGSKSCGEIGTNEFRD